MLLLPPSSTLFPYTTLFRSQNGICHVFSSYAFTYSTVRFLLSGRELRPRVEIVSPFAEPLQLLINAPAVTDRKSTRLNSSHGSISYAVFCLKKKKKKK